MSDPVTVRITAGAVPEPVSLPVNGVLRLTAEPSPDRPWGPLVSSDPRILSCESKPAAGGAVTGVCIPHLPGRVTVSTTSGPARLRWELRVTVVAHGLI